MLVLMSREDMRAGDSDRKAVETRLREALDEGRLDLSEYDDRLQRLWQAKTFGELDSLTTDLPTVRPAAGSQMMPAAGAVEADGDRGDRGGARKRLIGYAAPFIICTLVWAMTSVGSGTFHYFWPGWVLIPLVWGLLNEARHRRD
jgi:hypothetical protein